MDDDKVGLRVRTNWMAVNGARRAMGSPSGVGNGNLSDGCLFYIKRRPSNLLPKTSNFSNFLKVNDRAGPIIVNTETCRIISTVLLAGKTCNEDFKNLFS
jgi:hypothetical protein